jgi:hypothetical protein
VTRYAKALIAVIAAAATAVIAVLSDNTVTHAEWLQIAIAATTAVMVWLAANVPGTPAAKTYAAAVLAALNALAASLTGGISNAEWVGIALAVAATLGVWAIPNTPAPLTAAEQ